MSDALALAKHAMRWLEKDFDEIISRYKHVTLAGVDGKLIAVPVYEHRGPDDER
jgi:hypothetical protein